MRALIQRVSQANVSIAGQEKSRIGLGLLVLLGIATGDAHEDVEWLCKKIAALRIFNDENGNLNRSVQDVAGSVLVVSQFTLLASTAKGNRPSFLRSAKPDEAIPLYEAFLTALQPLIATPLQTGVFGADMQVSLCNDGPVTLFIDTKNRE